MHMWILITAVTARREKSGLGICCQMLTRAVAVTVIVTSSVTVTVTVVAAIA